MADEDSVLDTGGTAAGDTSAASQPPTSDTNASSAAAADATTAPQDDARPATSDSLGGGVAGGGGAGADPAQQAYDTNDVKATAPPSGAAGYPSTSSAGPGTQVSQYVQALMEQEEIIRIRMSQTDVESEEYKRLEQTLESIQQQRIDAEHDERTGGGLDEEDTLEDRNSMADYGDEEESTGFNEFDDEDEDDEVMGALPLGFGTESIQRLDKEVKTKERLMDRMSSELEQTTDRLNIMKGHLSNVQSELLHTQSLVDAKTKEIETEQHLRQLSQRETGRVRSDLSKLEKKMQETQDQLNVVLNRSFKAKEQLEAYRQQMNWNQEELLQWSLAAKQKEEDTEVINKYKKVDNARLSQLVLDLEKASQANLEAKAALDNEVTETLAMQIELDKTAEEYRKLHQERMDVIKQWDEAKQAMHRRDVAIAKAGDELVSLKEDLREKKEQLREQKDFLLKEQKNKEQLLRAIGAAERKLGIERVHLQKAGMGLRDIEDEVFASRNELNQVTADVARAQRTNEMMVEAIGQKRERIEELKAEVKEVKAMLDTEFAKTDNLQQRAKQMDELFKKNEQRLKQLDKDGQQFKKELFKSSQKLFDLRQTESDLIAQISSAQSTSKNVQSRIHELDQRSLKQQEMLYNIEFQVQQMERKVSYASGKRSVEETIELKQEIDKLKNVLEGVGHEHTLIIGQVRKLETDLKKAQRRHDDLVKAIHESREQLNQIDLETTSAQVALRKRERFKEELMVRHDVLKLEIKHLRDALDKLAQEVEALQNRKEQLTLAMAERQHEVSTNMDIQRAEAKVAEEARRNIQLDLNERQLRLNKLKQKFSIISAKMKTRMGAVLNEDEQSGDTERSQAYYIIAAAQEREELQRKGDQLNSGIRQAEKEIRLLQKTMDHLLQRNQNYRESFHKVTKGSADMQRKEALERQNRTQTDMLFHNKSRLREQAADYSEHKAVLDQLQQNMNRLRQDHSLLEEQHEAVQRKLEEERQKLKRAQQAVTNATKAFMASDAYKKGVGSSDVKEQKADDPTQPVPRQSKQKPLTELHIELVAQRQRTGAVLRLLKQVAEQSPDLQNTILDALAEAGLEPMSRPSTAASVVSNASSIASRASSRGGPVVTSTRGGVRGIPVPTSTVSIGDVRPRPPRGGSGRRSVPSSAGSTRSTGSRRGTLRKGLPSSRSRDDVKSKR